MNWGDARLPDRFWSKTTPEPNTGCWLWTGSLDTNGYALAWNGQRVMGGHRLAYEAAHGQVASGLVLDHERCDTPCCVNPSHLRPKTQRENILRGTAPTAHNARRTHCKNGHPLTPDNVYVRPRGNRECCTCSGRRAADRR